MELLKSQLKQVIGGTGGGGTSPDGPVREPKEKQAEPVFATASSSEPVASTKPTKP